MFRRKVVLLLLPMNNLPSIHKDIMRDMVSIAIAVAITILIFHPHRSFAFHSPVSTVKFSPSITSPCIESFVRLRETPMEYDGTDTEKELLPSNDSKINGKLNQPSKADLYTTDELVRLLSVHTTLSESIPDFVYSNDDDQIIGEKSSNNLSLQDLIVETVQGIESELRNDSPSMVDERKSYRFRSSFNKSDFERKIPQIRAIASDVDGTLLSSDHSLHPITEQAIIYAVEASYSPIHPLQYFFPATGKTRPGALNSLGPKMKTLLQRSPGVYVQGLYCVDASGTVVFEKKLSRIAVEQAEVLALQCNVTLVAYDGDSLYVTESALDHHVDEVSSRWGEPQPITLSTSILEHGPCFHKILFMNDDPVSMTRDVRPKLEKLAASLDCVITQAIPNMLELLPGGCSKAVGVQKLCEALGLDLSTQVCAIGDAENDLDMIKLASIGVAVGNAAPAVKNIAPIVMDETNDEGAAGQAIELFGLGNVIDLMK